MLDICKKFTASYQVGGGAGIGVNAKNPKVAAFYLKFGFIPSPTTPLQLFLPASKIIKSIATA